MKRSKRVTVLALCAILATGSLATVGPARVKAAALPTSPIVAVHVSEYTSALHGQPGQPAPASDVMGWYYDSFMHFQAYTLLEESLRADGTPFVEVTDADIEAGALIADGKPKYPILFSLMAEAISDTEVNALRQYVTSGGFVYVGGSSWIRTPTGSYRNTPSGRAEFALAAEMGLESQPSGTKPQGGTWSWGYAKSIKRLADSRLVDHLVPKGEKLEWALPRRFDSDAFGLWNTDGGFHQMWITRPAAANPATVLAVGDTTQVGDYKDFPFLATRQHGLGRFIYHAEMAPLAGWGGYTPDTSEYLFVRRAIEWAFETAGVPVVRLGAWRYPYRAALQTRWDMDWYPGDLRNLVDIERARGVRGQYFFVSDLAAVDSGNWALWAQRQGAIVGSHNRVHVGPDVQDATSAAANISDSLDALRSWTGTRPKAWVSPKYQSVRDESFQTLVDAGVETAGEQQVGPFPHFALSMKVPRKHYDLLQLPTSEWLAASADNSDSRGRLERIPSSEIPNVVDAYYDLGGLINVYGHPYPENESRVRDLIDRAIAKGGVWLTHATEIRDWWAQRDAVAIAPSYSTDGHISDITVALSGSTDASTCVDVFPPFFDPATVQDLEVRIDGVPSTDYSFVPGGLKARVGTAAELKVHWTRGPAVASEQWVQTSKGDFQQGTLAGVDASSAPGEVRLAAQAGGGAFFWDGFEYAPNGAAPAWKPVTGVWGVDDMEYRQGDTSASYKHAWAGDPEWTDYTLEARTRLVSGSFGGQIAGRLDPITGARYALWVYPTSNTLKLVKFTSWTTWTQLGETKSIPTIGTEWHRLALRFSGPTITASYDGVDYVTATDTLRPKGAVGLETYGSVTAFDDIRVSVPGTRFVASGTYLSPPFDAGSAEVSWDGIAFGGSVAPATTLRLRTRSAATTVALATAAWSDYVVGREGPVAQPHQRWIQFEASFTTADASSTPVLQDVTVAFRRPPDLTAPAPPSAVDVADTAEGGTLNVSWMNPSDADFHHVHVYRSDATGTLGPLVFDDVQATSAKDTGLLDGKRYFYTVRAVDLSGNESANRDQHVGVPSSLFGRSNTALGFDPVDDAVIVNDAPALDTPGGLTVEARVRLNSNNGLGIIAGRFEGTDVSWNLYYDEYGRVLFYVRRPDDAGYVQAISPWYTMKVGVWHHVAGVLDPASGAVSVYVDGQRVGSAGYTQGAARAGSARLGINGAPDGSGARYCGDATIDEVRVSSVARYSGQSFTVSVQPFEPDTSTVGLWHFDEAEGVMTADASTNHLDSSFVGDPEWVPGYAFISDFVPPAAPTSIVATPTGISGSVRLSWVNPSDIDFSHVHVYRSSTPGDLGGLVQDNVIGDSVIDTGLLNGYTYHYTVRAVDRSGNESTNTAQYAAMPTGPIQDLALRFDATDDFVIVPDSPSLDTTGALTVEAWVYPEYVAARNAVLVSRWDGSDISWELYYDRDGRAFFYVRDPDNTSYVQVNSETEIVRTGDWFHVAGVLDPTAHQLRLYVNGVLRASRGYAASGPRTGAARIGINGEPLGNGAVDLGACTIDEVRVSSAVRYIGTSYTVPTGRFPVDPATIGLWHFDDGIGLQALDSSTNGNHGQFKGDPEWVLR